MYVTLFICAPILATVLVFVVPLNTKLKRKLTKHLFVASCDLAARYVQSLRATTTRPIYRTLHRAVLNLELVVLLFLASVFGVNKQLTRFFLLTMQSCARA
jgi:hypothetical protein